MNKLDMDYGMDIQALLAMGLHSPSVGLGLELSVA